MSILQSRSRLEKSALKILGEIMLGVKYQQSQSTASVNPWLENMVGLFSSPFDFGDCSFLGDVLLHNRD